MLDKREKRIFVIEIEIKDECWDYKIGDKHMIPIVSNNYNNAIRTFENKHWGSEYPMYQIVRINDCLDCGFFYPKHEQFKELFKSNVDTNIKRFGKKHA